MIKKLTHKKKVWTVFSVAMIVLAVVLFITKNYPIAIVGTSIITQKYFDVARGIVEKLEPNATESAAYDQLLKNKSLQELFSSPDIDGEYNYEISGKDTEYQDLLQKYFNSDLKLFEEFVTKPAAYDAAAKIAYNSDIESNKLAFDRIKDILSQIEKGSLFEDLAKTKSDDKVSGQFGGDLGFMPENQILPELRVRLSGSKVGQINKQVIVSRLGYHILYPLQTADKDGQKYWHLKHILVTTEGYDEWLKGKLSHLWVWRIK